MALVERSVTASRLCYSHSRGVDCCTAVQPSPDPPSRAPEHEKKRSCPVPGCHTDPVVSIQWPIVSLRCNKHESERDTCCNLALCCISSDPPATPAIHCMEFDFRDVRQLLDAVNAEKVSCDEKSLAHPAHRADARGMDGSGHQLAGY